MAIGDWHKWQRRTMLPTCRPADCQLAHRLPSAARFLLCRVHSIADGELAKPVEPDEGIRANFAGAHPHRLSALFAFRHDLLHSHRHRLEFAADGAGHTANAAQSRPHWHGAFPDALRDGTDFASSL